MRVLVVSQWFPPEPRELYLELAQAFQRAGHEVEAVTGFPNWPGGKLYPGYRIRMVQREVLGGVPTVRLPLYPNHNAGGVKRIWNLMSLAVSLWILGPFVLKRAKHIHVVQLPFLVFSAKWLAFWWGAKVTMEVQDMWPDTFEATGAVTNLKALKMVERLCQSAYRACVKVRVISPGFKRELASRGVPEGKLEVISNWIDDEAHKPLPEGAPYEGPTLPDGFRILYAGSIGIPQQLKVALDAAEQLADRPDIHFLFAGDGVEREGLEKDAKDRGLANVHFLGRFAQDEMGALYAQVDALFVHLAPDPLFAITIPSKVVSYMAYEKPILAAIEGDTRQVVEEAGAGIAINPGDPTALAEAARRLADLSPDERRRMAEAGRKAAESDFSFREAVPKLAALLEPGA